MESHRCAKCGEPGANLCAACGEVGYCKKECQVSHWSVHRQTCLNVSRRAAAFESFCSKIHGNIRVAIAHAVENSTCTVVYVDIPETFTDFCRNTMHLPSISLGCAAHVDCTPHVENNPQVNDDTQHPRDTCTVTYRFLDCKRDVIVPIPAAPEEIRVRYPNPQVVLCVE